MEQKLNRTLDYKGNESPEHSTYKQDRKQGRKDKMLGGLIEEIQHLSPRSPRENRNNQKAKRWHRDARTSHKWNSRLQPARTTQPSSVSADVSTGHTQVDFQNPGDKAQASGGKQAGHGEKNRNRLRHLNSSGRRVTTKQNWKEKPFNPHFYKPH